MSMPWHEEETPAATFAQEEEEQSWDFNVKWAIGLKRGQTVSGLGTDVINFRPRLDEAPYASSFATTLS
uniref:Uncharacterized protein n=1 Tax=Vespula pensylvanica TaxID=30213 RepID=A0A834NC65_VESPE|nr:hypothetical protein H0235_015399 [Vespula pensylvanica]